MTEVIMPKMGDGMEEGTLLEWLKKDGDVVKSGEVIGTIQTDKATLELEAPGKGTLRGIILQPGETVPVGRPIALILKDGEAVPKDWAPGATAKGAPAAAEAASVSVAAVVSESSAPPKVSERSDRVKASPLAKKVAAEAGVDLASIAGSGPGGRVIEKDVRDAIEQHGTKMPDMKPAKAVAGSVKIPLNRLRQIIAERTAQSKQQVPHFYVTVEVDLDRIMMIREAFKAEEGGKISVNDFVVRAACLALQQMPMVNSTFHGDHIMQSGDVHIGIAAAVDDGLLVPVIKNCDALTLRDISDASRGLVAKARDGKLHPDEMSGSTFSISNMGMLDVDNFAAIINQPNSAIVAIGTARRKPFVTEDDEIDIRWQMNMTGSFDHRVVDGAIGAQFMNVMKAYLENPTRLLS